MSADNAEMSVRIEVDGVDGAGKAGDGDDVVGDADHRVQTQSGANGEFVGEIAEEGS